MDKILTNGQSGYDAVERDDLNDRLFRVMSVMAIADGEELDTIEPLSPAKITKYNPYRTTSQVYLATLSYASIDHTTGDVLFTITQSYSDPMSAPDFIYCDGMVFDGGIVVSGDDVIISDPVAYAFFTEATRLGNIADGEYIEAHMFIDEPSGGAYCVDFQLDWRGMAKKTPVPADLFSDIDARVKSGDSRDAYSLWHKIYPTGLDVSYTSVSGITSLNFDTGIVCASVKSRHAPLYISGTVTGLSGTSFNVNLYLNIDGMPQALIPDYHMHPGQYLYDISAENDDASVSTLTLTVAGKDVTGKYMLGDEVLITKTGVADVSTTITGAPVYAGGDTTFTVAAAPATGSGYTVSLPYDYQDGTQFGGAVRSAYRTPPMAKMCILRGKIVLNNLFPSIATYPASANIDNIAYVYRAGEFDGMMPAYALANYDVDITSRTYTETGDVTMDSIASMRYIGHYGRNSLYANTHTAPIAIDLDIPYVGTKDTSIVTVTDECPAPITVASNNIEIDVESAIAKACTTVAQTEPGAGEYYFSRLNMPGRQAISSISVRKIYIIGSFMSDSRFIVAYMGDAGYELISALKAPQGENVLLASIDTDDDTFEMDAASDYSGEVLITIGEEDMTGIVTASDKIVASIVRGANRTTPAVHDALSPIYLNSISPAVGYADEEIICGAPMAAPTEVYTISVDDELMSAEVANGSDTMAVKRPALGTAQSPHVDKSPVYVYDRNFHNSYCGTIAEITGDPVTAIAISDNVPSDAKATDGYLLINGEIVKYASYSSATFSIASAASRGRYGSTKITLVVGMPVYYISYFTIDAIRPNISRTCEYNDRYTPIISLPMHYDNDPVRYGAKAVYLIEARYETGQKTKVW